MFLSLVIDFISVGLWQDWMENHSREYMVEKNHLPNGNCKGDEGKKRGKLYTLQSQDLNCKSSGKNF